MTALFVITTLSLVGTVVNTALIFLVVHKQNATIVRVVTEEIPKLLASLLQMIGERHAADTLLRSVPTPAAPAATADGDETLPTHRPRQIGLSGR